MDFRQWLEKMTSQINEWATSRNVSVHELEIEPPVSEERLRVALESLQGDIPPDLKEFYLTGAAMANVEFTLDIPTELGFKRDWNVKSSLGGGLQIPSPEKLSRLRQDFAMMVPEPDDPKFEPFLQHGLPLSIYRNSDVMLFLKENVALQAGIYALPYATLMEDTFCYRYAGSLSEWLEFLERSCYIGISWYDVSFWHEDDRLIPNQKLTDRLKAIIDLGRV